MDREISSKEQARRRTRIYIIGSVVALAIAFGFIQFSNIVEPAVKGNVLITSVAS